jgi:Pyridoxal-dependent decarboxylase conserved domain
LISALDDHLPETPGKAADIIAFLDEYGSPATVASAGGRYFGFVTGGALPVTVAAQYLATAWDQNCFSYISSPAIACFETTALRWVKEALGLPASVEGALVTGATMANFTCLAAARNRVLQRYGWDVDQQGLFGAPALTVFVDDVKHEFFNAVIDDFDEARRERKKRHRRWLVQLNPAAFGKLFLICDITIYRLSAGLRPFS